MRLSALQVLLLFVLAADCFADSLSQHAARFRKQLDELTLPWWLETTRDEKHGGYLLVDDVASKSKAREKQLVTQTRLIWSFAHAHRKGFSHGDRDYLAAAKQGYRFLNEFFLDKKNGGYFWKTDLAGQSLNDRKIVYGEAFAIYAFVELHRASHEKEPLERAIRLFRLLQEKAHDPRHGGWVEHFSRDWTPILKPDRYAEVEVPGYKSANTHLHLMEAFAELYDVTQDAEVKKALTEALGINMKYFYPAEPGKSCFHRRADWGEVDDPKSAGLSYGHNVEFAWLMIRAQETLRIRPSWRHFNKHIEHALKYGFDHQLGGVYNRGFDDQPATQKDKIWWVQTEMIAALSDALRHERDRDFSRALDKLLHFVEKHQLDDKGVWLDTVLPDGTPRNNSKAHNWKANYHDFRALMKFCEAFDPIRSFH